MLEPSEIHLSISFQMLSNIEFANCSGVSTDYDVSAVCAEEVSLVIVSGDFLAATYRAGRL